MTYLDRWRELRTDVRRLLPGARSVVVVAHAYRQVPEQDRTSARGQEAQDDKVTSRQGDEATDGREAHSAIRDPRSAIGRVAQYAWGRDYHRVIRKKLHRLVDALRRAVAEPFEARVCVDTAPLVEREIAAAAGVGWIGKNTLVLHPELGSFFFLGAIVTTLELAPSMPMADHCGSCTRCLAACPTGALTAAYQMDARRCISYLTIEHRGPIDEELQPLMGDWLYGCDVCQDVCPHNGPAPPAREPAYRPAGNPLVPAAGVEQVLRMDASDWAKALAGSAMKRATLPMLQRNARIVGANAAGRRTAIGQDGGDEAAPFS
ncbi:MAG: tRNA epoxyqueuosine(34) reductase QueG [Phycisphaerae bacterium]|jgi:epoxyqueuosine reductase